MGLVGLGVGERDYSGERIDLDGRKGRERGRVEVMYARLLRTLRRKGREKKEKKKRKGKGVRGPVEA